MRNYQLLDTATIEENVLKLSKNIINLDSSFIHPKTPGNIRTEILLNLKEMNL